jgi:hypothetical protein
VNTFKSIGVAVLLAVPILLTSAFASPKGDLETAMSYDGLQKISVKGIDLAYARPGATLAGYSRVMLEPVDVAFHKDWNPTKARSRLKLSAEERENIKTGVAKIVYDEFVKALQSKSGYQIVSEVGPDVLRVKAHIVNLFVNAPDTIFVELFYSETGEILARIADRRAARRAGKVRLTNSVVNADEARSIASEWARILRDALDRAHAIGK